MTEFTDITYEVDNGLAWITINRPERYNAFRARTLDELIRAFKMAWASSEVGVICLTGAGDKAFCTGGDQKQRAETGDYGRPRRACSRWIRCIGSSATCQSPSSPR